MDTVISWVMVVAALLVLALVFGPQVLAGIYWFLATVAQSVIFFFDTIFSVALIPAVPWLMWVIWGLLIGGALGFWTLAPVYGLRQYRLIIVIVPPALMGIVLGVRLMCGH